MFQCSRTGRFAIFILPLVGLVTSACQSSNNNTATIAVSGSRIVNGQEAEVADVGQNGLAESVVNIISAIKSSDRKQIISADWCTGTLIDPQVVLTAAHCFPKGVEAPDVVIRLHLVSPSVGIAESKMTSYFADTIVVNPGYDHAGISAASVGQDQSDLALVRISRPVPTGTRIAQLPPANFDLRTVDALLAIGYGQSNERYNAPENDNGAGVLRYTTFPKGKFRIWPTSIDRSSASFDDLIKNMLYGGMIATTSVWSSICDGDSGGPLMAMVKNSSPNMVVGVTESAFPSFEGDQQIDYEAALKAGNPSLFYKKHPDAKICSGGQNFFVNLAPEVGWITKSKKALLTKASIKPPGA